MSKPYKDWRGRRLQAAWHVLRGKAVMWRVIIIADHDDPSLIRIAHFKGSHLWLTQSVIDLPSWRTGEASETYAQLTAKPIPPNALVDPQGNVWDTNGW